MMIIVHPLLDWLDDVGTTQSQIVHNRKSTHLTQNITSRWWRSTSILSLTAAGLKTHITTHNTQHFFTVESKLIRAATTPHCRFGRGCPSASSKSVPQLVCELFPNCRLFFTLKISKKKLIVKLKESHLNWHVPSQQQLRSTRPPKTKKETPNKLWN